jgi:nitroreductase
MTDFDIAEADRLLKTTKQVRKRMDLTRPVPRELLLECIEVAGHAPTGGNIQANRWLVVDDDELKAQIAPYYQQVGYPYLEEQMAGIADPTQQRVADSARYLLDHIAEVPAMVIATRLGVPGAHNFEAASFHGSVAPAVWSFQIAARVRGLGSAWTTFHLAHEREVGELLGIPDTVTQVALLPVGFYTGAGFRPAARRDATSITYFNGWRRRLDQVS